MDEKKIVIDLNLSMVDYFTIVDEIVSEFFDKDGTYQPQIGHLNIIRLFYNNCVKDSKFEETIPHTIMDAMELEPLINDSEFMIEFDKAVRFDKEHLMIGFDFKNALRDALDIVETKKNSVERLIDYVRVHVVSLLQDFSATVTDENIKEVAQIAKDISDGKLTAQDIADAYSNTARYNEVVSAGKE